jgi:hypothetical protein
MKPARGDKQAKNAGTCHLEAHRMKHKGSFHIGMPSATTPKKSFSNTDNRLKTKAKARRR